MITQIMKLLIIYMQLDINRVMNQFLPTLLQLIVSNQVLALRQSTAESFAEDFDQVVFQNYQGHVREI